MRTALASFLGYSLFALACGPAPAPQTPPPATNVSPPSTGEPMSPEPSSTAPAPAPAPSASDTHFPGSVWKDRDMGVAVPDDWRSCSAASDCTLVVTTCCDQCNGGKAVAVNTAHARDVEQKYPKQCKNTACTERACFTRAACETNRCVMQWESAP